MNTTDIQYVSNEQGETVAVIIPIEIWRELQSEKETAYLLEGKEAYYRTSASCLQITPIQ